MNIAIVGNCQTIVLDTAVREAFRDNPDVHVHLISSGSAATDETKSFLAAADVLVHQVTSANVNRSGLMDLGPEAARRVAFPVLFGRFIYPYSGSKTHPRNPESCTSGIPAGWYCGHMTDSRLVWHMENGRGRDSHELAESYLEEDFSKLIDLGRLYEFDKGQAEMLARMTGFEWWPLIERNYQHVPVFWTYAHPGGLLLRPLCRFVLEKLGLGLSSADIDNVVNRIREPYEGAHMPIHPSVAAYFGIEWARSDYRYRYRNEGNFTAQEYARRFIDFEYDRRLEEALFDLYHRGRVGEALDGLIAARARLPNSPYLLLHLSEAYKALGLQSPALEAILHAVELDPTRKENVLALCSLARETLGRPPEILPVAAAAGHAAYV